MSCILGEFNSVEALRRLAVEKGYQAIEKEKENQNQNQFRRAAWLYLLGLPPSPSTSTSNHSTSKNATSNLLEQSQNLDSQLDSDGWQLTRDFDETSSWTEAGGVTATTATTAQQEEDQWTTATSKRSKRVKRSLNGHSENGEAEGEAEAEADQDDGRESNTTTSNSQSESTTNPSSISTSDLSNNRFAINLENQSISKTKNKNQRKKKKKEKANRKDEKGGLDESNLNLNGGEKGKRKEIEDDGTHRDERQVELDIMRSFVGFQDGVLKDPTLRQRRRDQLREVVVGVLRRHPALSYFQGYHDILSIILLTLNPNEPPPGPTTISPWESIEERDSTLEACERISLHFVRDSMTENMDPVMGQLKVVRNILRLVDGELATVVEQASPLPFFALPWLLTLLSHDLSFKTSQLIFDFIISHGPASVLYLCVAIILTKKETLKSEPDLCSDPAFLHQFLSQLPDLQSQSSKYFQLSDTTISSTSASSSNSEKDPSSDSTSRPSKLQTEKSPSLSSFNSTEDLHLDSDVYPPDSKGSLNSTQIEKEAEESDEDDWERKREPLKVELKEMLEKVVELMEKYPLELVADPMGKKSVIWTWEEIFSEKKVEENGLMESQKGSDSPQGVEEGSNGNDGSFIKVEKKGKGKKKNIKDETTPSNSISSTHNPTQEPTTQTKKIESPSPSRIQNWKVQDQLAEKIVSAGGIDVVKNPNPSPSTSVAGDESPPIYEYSKESKELKGDSEFKKKGKSDQKKKRDFAMTTAATVVGVAGVLLAVYSTNNGSSNGNVAKAAIGYAGTLLGGIGGDW